MVGVCTGRRVGGRSRRAENVDAVGEGGAWLASDDEAERQQPKEKGSGEAPE